MARDKKIHQQKCVNKVYSWHWNHSAVCQLLMRTIFETLSFSIKTINLLKGKYDLDQELRPHLATAVTLNIRKTVVTLIICLHPDSLVQGICWFISNRQETLPDIHTVSLVHITKLWEFITIAKSSVPSANDQLGVRTSTKAFKDGHFSCIFLTQIINVSQTNMRFNSQTAFHCEFV